MISLTPPSPALSESRKGKTVTLTPRHRLLLHRLLHRDVRKCSAAAMDTFRRFGWTCGGGIGFELTAMGRQIAEMSELSAPTKTLTVEVSAVPLALDRNPARH